MDKKRYYDIMWGGAWLEYEEWKLGWHFCPDYDDLLIGPGMPDWDKCLLTHCKRFAEEER